MDLVQAIWLSSVSGAGLFFGAGAMARSAWGGRRREVDRGALGLAEERIAALEHAGERAARRVAEAEEKAAVLAASLEAESRRRATDGQEIARLNLLVDRQQVEAIKLRAAANRPEEARDDEAPRLRGLILERTREIEGLKASAARAEGELAAARAALAAREAELGKARALLVVREAELGKVRPLLATRETELGKARADLATRDGELRAARAAAATASQHMAEAARLREQNGALRVELDALEKERGATRALAELTQRNLELGLRARALEQRGEDLGRKAAEADDLRQRVRSLESAEVEADELRARVAELESRGLAERLAESVARAPAGPISAPTSAREQRLEAALERHLAALARAEAGCVSAVLTDQNGLLVAASPGSDRRDELGAAASLMTTTVERVRLMLPLAGPRSIEIVDENRVVLRTRWLEAAGDVLLVTTLGVAAEAALSRSDPERAIVSRLSELA